MKIKFFLHAAIVLITAQTVITQTLESGQTPAPKPCFDFTGTGRTSFATTIGNQMDGQNIIWNILSNGGDGAAQMFSFGRGGLESRDGLAPGYYDNDNRADAAVWRLSGFQSGTGTFYIRPSTLADSNSSAATAVQWGAFPDLTTGLEGDYDGDGRDDLTVVRRDPGNYVWYILRSGTNTFSAVNFGLTSDIATAGADYNGDGRDEITVIRTYPAPHTIASTYFAGDSNTGALVLAQDWGANRDVYVIGDYLGDNRADFAVMRKRNSAGGTPEATWYILENGGSGQIVIRQFGYGDAGPATDLAVCGDYNGDGKQDIAVYRTTGTYYWMNSPDFNTVSSQQWSVPNAVNIPVGMIHTYNR